MKIQSKMNYNAFGSKIFSGSISVEKISSIPIIPISMHPSSFMVTQSSIDTYFKAILREIESLKHRVECLEEMLVKINE